jgi:predicted dehydrogenase
MHNIGIIGLGIMGQRMLQAAYKHDNFHIGSIWDLNDSAIDKIQNQYVDIDSSTSADELLNLESLDVIYIATPPSIHVSYARAAMDNGKAIFCEKPLAVNLDESRSLVKDISASGLPNAINFPLATSLTVLTLEEDIQRKEHGEIERIEIRFHFSEWPRTWQRGAASWLAGKDEGGFLREVYSHFVYLTHRIIGDSELNSSRVTLGNGPDSAEIFAEAHLNCGDVPIYMSGAVGGVAPDFNEWTVYGTKKSYRLQDWGLLKVADANRWYDVMPRGEQRSPLANQLNNLSQMLSGEGHMLPDFSEGLKVQEIIEGILGQS